MKASTAIAAGVLHAALMTLAFPPIGLWPAALVAIVPLIWAAARIQEVATGTGTPRLRATLKPALYVSLGALPFFAFQQHWVLKVTALGYFPLVVGMALFTGAFVWLTAELRVRLRGWPLPRATGEGRAGSLPYTIVVPLVWTALEVFRGEVAFSGYPWFLLAHPLIDAPLLPHPAAVLGTYFVSFLAAMLGGIAADLMTARAAAAHDVPRVRPKGNPCERRATVHLPRSAALAGLAFYIVAVSGSVLMKRAGDNPEDPRFRIAVIQTNIPQDNKLAWTIEQKLEDFARFLELTAAAAEAEPAPDLIIWPETMFPDMLDPQAVGELRRAGVFYHVDRRIRPEGYVHATEFHDRTVQLQRELNVPFMIGVVGIDNLRLDPGPRGEIVVDIEAQYNSVMLVNRGRVNPQRYDKLALTPFGEVMPYLHHWPWLEHQLMAIGARGMTFDLSPGEQPRYFEVDMKNAGPVSIATPICFEVTKPRITRLLLSRIPPDRPRLLVNTTNDGWFARYDGGRLQHLQIARWRAMELGVPVVRAANTGISAWIDAQGRIVRKGTDDGDLSRADGILTADVHATTGGTIYTALGESFGSIILAAGAALTLLAFTRRRGGHKTAAVD